TQQLHPSLRRSPLIPSPLHSYFYLKYPKRLRINSMRSLFTLSQHHLMIYYIPHESKKLADIGKFYYICGKKIKYLLLSI
ncbi:MAG: hypothetical protein K2G08_10470, partial [Paramuribaculum sp.]|nr:hypothetical protein [Paramuribaculum sp.]